MVNISLCKSRSVSTAPFTRATGLPLGWLTVFCGVENWRGGVRGNLGGCGGDGKQSYSDCIPVLHNFSSPLRFKD